MQTIAIVGLGLIGGSMALALRRRQKKGAYCLLGIDADPAVLQAALDKGAVDEAGGPELLEKAEVVILALPPETAVTFLKENIHHMRRETLVTDVCGIKRAVVESCTPLCREHDLDYIGGHPMAGKEKNGFANADEELFVGASYILTPTADTPDRAVEIMKEIAGALGCTRMTITTPGIHDRMIAFTSQLPHVLAGAYVKSPCCPRHQGFSAGSYRDVSRVATVDEKLWSQLFLLNADDLTAEIDTLIAHLQDYRRALAEGDKEKLEAAIRHGREIKENEGQPEA